MIPPLYNHRVLQGAALRGRQLYFIFPTPPDPLVKASKAPFLTLRVATPSGAPRQAPLAGTPKYRNMLGNSLPVPINNRKLPELFGLSTMKEYVMHHLLHIVFPGMLHAIISNGMILSYSAIEGSKPPEPLKAQELCFEEL